jgi:hypothetical protein
MRLRALLAVVSATLLLAATTATATAAIPAPPGGPILVVTGGDHYGDYYAEILRAEGLNEFARADVSQLSADTLASYDVVVLASTGLSSAQVATMDAWVRGGGNLVAMRPDKALAPLLGLSDAGGTLSNGYLRVDTSQPPGKGIVDQTIQYHGDADRYALAGARSVATLYSDATTATASPAVTLRSVGGAGGEAAAFTYDLGRSVIWTRQGNPAWADRSHDADVPTACTGPTTCSRACRARTIGWTGPRSRSPRPTSSSACWPTSSPTWRAIA